MRRLPGRGLSFGTSPERNAPESLTQVVPGPTTATSRVQAGRAALDQVECRPARAQTTTRLLTARVESEAGESQAKTLYLNSSCAGLTRRSHTFSRHPEEPRPCAASRRMAAGTRGPSFEARRESGEHLRMTEVFGLAISNIGLTAFWRRAAARPGSRTGSPAACRRRMASESPTGTARGHGCPRSAQTRLRCCAARRAI